MCSTVHAGVAEEEQEQCCSTPVPSPPSPFAGRASGGGVRHAAAVVSSAVLSPGRPAILSVFVVRAWREAQGMEQLAVYESVKQRTAFVSPCTWRVLACNTCPGARHGPVRILAATQTPRYDPTSDTERYLFELQAVCLSSRSHMGSARVALRLSIGDEHPVSSDFQLLARVRKGEPKPRHAPMYRLLDEAALEAALPAPPLESQHTSYIHTSGAAHFTVPVVVLLYENSVRLPLSAAHGILREMAPDKLPGMLGFVPKLLVGMTSPEALRALAEADGTSLCLRAALGGTPCAGADPLLWYGIVIATFSSSTLAGLFVQLAEDFLRCRNGAQNPLHCDTVAVGLSRIVHTITNW
eukprot:TRINITY_DN11481_c0_g1_i1.p1 TRINITY_DN11481_c0_g1~~TRINITY_DN11481_c0_g1_i1.p1  ORF type:complete len:354 (-),score=97.56 TRINITY_DN11481_c0_g1_i1:112-1173(-)